MDKRCYSRAKICLPNSEHGEFVYGAFNRYDSCIVTASGESVDVIKSTLGRYMGLKDKQGKMIFFHSHNKRLMEES